MDPHTATCLKAYDTCRDKPLKTIVYSTAERSEEHTSELQSHSELVCRLLLEKKKQNKKKKKKSER